jgi:phage tail tube protein FII
MPNYSFTVKRYKAYLNGNPIATGLADAVTPKLTNPKAEISGAGVIPFDVPISGMPKMGAATLTFHSPGSDFYSLFSGGAATIRLASAIYTYQSGANNGATPTLPSTPTVPEIIVMTGLPDELDPGRRESGNKATCTVQLLPSYLYIEMGGVEYVEVDPINGVCRLLGVDVNAQDGI